MIDRSSSGEGVQYRKASPPSSAASPRKKLCLPIVTPPKEMRSSDSFNLEDGDGPLRRGKEEDRVSSSRRRRSYQRQPDSSSRGYGGGADSVSTPQLVDELVDECDEAIQRSFNSSFASVSYGGGGSESWAGSERKPLPSAFPSSPLVTSDPIEIDGSPPPSP
eukprot:CAMPEP_0113587162 /NCGR_PEP_ID=MMETSP0015_2-20120614/34733_1 /TAXON_ID=2838 /ORGANISM="Odontella" /LENGTH=162 /DNA_ID=CAMNT_0000492747 /DNA_START=211 /DNA_END=695 /DNA_ORIENTATION=+ /assembly_acc=CAM_ASM_000160